MSEMRDQVAALLRGIDRYNPENLYILEKYIDSLSAENSYDLEASLAVLKLYQFNPGFFQMRVVVQILLKALTNLPHTDFTLCKCLIDAAKLEEDPIRRIIAVADLLETCQFKMFWAQLADIMDQKIVCDGFDDSIRRFICYAVSITYQVIKKSVLKELLGNISEAQVNQWIAKSNWKDQGDGYIFIANQEDSIKTKNITEKITFEGVAAIMATAAATHYQK